MLFFPSLEFKATDILGILAKYWFIKGDEATICSL